MMRAKSTIQGRRNWLLPASLTGATCGVNLWNVANAFLTAQQDTEVSVGTRL